MGEKAMLRVICYDIASDRLRRRAAAVLEEMAARVQFSVYETRLTHVQARRLMARLHRLTDRGDSLRLYTIPDTMIERCDETGGPAILGGARYWLA